MKTIILIAFIAIAASPIYADEGLEAKKHEKRGLLGLGYGGYYSGLGGYGGLGHLGSPVLSVNHGVLPSAYSHAAPAVSYGHVGANYHAAPLYTAPALRLGYSGLGGLGGLGLGGHGLNYLHGANYW